MAIGFPGSPFNKKQFSVDSKLYEYNSTLGVWSKGVRAPVSPGTASITDLSQLTDGSSLLDNVGSTIPSYATEVEILSLSVGVQDGQMAYAEDTDKLYVFSGYSWYKTSTAIEYVPPPPASWYGDRGIVNASSDSTIEYFDITTSGTTSDFGSFPTNVNSVGSTSATTNGTLAVTLGVGTADYSEDMWTYVNVPTVGNATEIGALRISQQSHAAVSDATYGVFEFGTPGNIEYVTIATSGTSSTWGADVNSGFRKTGAGDGTYGLFAGARASNDGETHITKLTIATTGSATDHGDLLEGRWKMAGGGDGTYALFAGGGTNRNSAFQAWTNIEYVTVATSSGGTTFGSLSTQRSAPVGSHNDTRLVISGGDTSGRGVGIISSQEYITMGTTGTATSFGNLSSPEYYNSGTSGAAA